MISIRTFNSQQLADYIRSPEYDAFDFVPISRHRALSHLHNPRAEKEDILLLMAYEDDRPVGYLGVLPDHIMNGGQVIRCGWMSCIWIDDCQRGKGIARLLVETCDQVWQHKILGTDFAEASGNLFDKMGIFDELPLKQGVRLYVRSCLHRILPLKHTFFKQTAPVWKALDKLINLVFDLRFFFVRRTPFKTELISVMDQETVTFIETHNHNELFRRGIKELEWIKQYPWILSGPEDASSCKYHFSSLDCSFDFYIVKLRNKDHQLVAVLFLTKRDRSLKLPYVYITPGNELLTASCIEDFMLSWRIDTFTCYHPELSVIFKTQQTIALFKKTMKRRYIITKTLKGQMAGADEKLIQDGDADAAFT
jgi:GNAT superfamily N-acetyltransferase